MDRIDEAAAGGSERPSTSADLSVTAVQTEDGHPRSLAETPLAQMSRPKAGKEEPIHPVLSGKGATPLGPAPTSVEVGIPAQHAPDRQASPIPAIEPPKSWTTEDKQLFGSLSRVTQERIAQRERAGEADFGRTPNETVEKLKGLMGKERTGEHSTQHYEAALPLILIRCCSSRPPSSQTSRRWPTPNVWHART